MGGKAFSYIGLESTRMDKELFHTIESEILKYLSDSNIKGAAIPYIKEKKDFGDIDTLVELTGNNKDDIYVANTLLKLAKDNFYPVYSSGNVLSILYKNKYQVDFIKVTKDQFDFSLNYYSWNDMGNILGRMLKEHGYKVGWQGLYYVYRKDANYKNNILLSYNFEDVLDILKLEYKEYKSGFLTFEHMFSFITSSAYFNPAKFQFSALSNKDRVRDKKRVTYNKFLNYNNSREFNNIEKPIGPFEKYNHLQNEIDLLDIEYNKSAEFKSKFNGNIISNLTGLTGKELGSFMGKLRNKFSDEELILNLEQIVLNEIN